MQTQHIASYGSERSEGSKSTSFQIRRAVTAAAAQRGTRLRKGRACTPSCLHSNVLSRHKHPLSLQLTDHHCGNRRFIFPAPLNCLWGG